MTPIKVPAEAFITKIRALYDIEHVLVKALPKMHKAATNEELKNGFELHLRETEVHITRLEQIFDMLGEKPKKLKCEGIRGIVEDASWVLKEVRASDFTHDAMIAAAARYAEHYEMAGYMSAIQEAEVLNLPAAVSLLQTTLLEEERADEKLAQALLQNFTDAVGGESFPTEDSME